MAEVSVNSFRTSLYLGCIVGIIKVALLKTPSESLMDVVMQVNEFVGHGDRYIGSLFRVDEPVPDDSLVPPQWFVLPVA